MVVNGDEFQNIELQRVLEANGPSTGGLLSHQHNPRLHHTPTVTDPHVDPSQPPIPMSTAGDMLREMVKNKETMIAHRGNHLGSDIGRYDSVDSEASDASTLVSTMSDIFDEDTAMERRKKFFINHHSIRSTTSDTEVQLHQASKVSVCVCERRDGMRRMCW